MIKAYTFVLLGISLFAICRPLGRRIAIYNHGPGHVWLERLAILSMAVCGVLLAAWGARMTRCDSTSNWLGGCWGPPPALTRYLQDGERAMREFESAHQQFVWAMTILIGVAFIVFRRRLARLLAAFDQRGEDRSSERWPLIMVTMMGAWWMILGGIALLGSLS